MQKPPPACTRSTVKCDSDNSAWKGAVPFHAKAAFLARQGIQPKFCCKCGQQSAANLRLYTKSSAAAAAPRAFPQVAIGATSIDGYTTEKMPHQRAPNCSEFAVVYQSTAATPDVGEEAHSKDKPPPRFPTAEGAACFASADGRRGPPLPGSKIPSTGKAQPSAAAGGTFAAPAVTKPRKKQRAACGTAGTGVSRFRRHHIQFIKVSRGRRRRTGGKKANDAVGERPSRRRRGRT